MSDLPVGPTQTSWVLNVKSQFAQLHTSVKGEQFSEGKVVQLELSQPWSQSVLADITGWT